ncbi:MAG: replicative DNA helicase [Dehalococcoidia bacterium]|nr:replicative DNA helicase [Dehalococcoidia bacterium]
MAENGKLPPHNVEAEEAVLGSLLVDPDSVAEVAIFLKPEAFYREKNQWVYEACLALYDRGEAINQITVAQELANRGRLEVVGGVAFLSHLVETIPTSLHIKDYARIVSNHYVHRKLISASAEIARIGYEASPDIDQALSRAEDAIFRVRRGESPRDFVHIRPILDQYWDEKMIVGAGLEEPGRIAHVDTGFPAVDELLGGMQRSDMVVLAARTTLGKTSLALCIARNAAMEQGAHVAIFSLEMSKETLVRRLLAIEAEVDSKRILTRQWTPMQERRVVEATARLANLPIYIDDSPLLRVVEMRGKARRLNQERGIDLIIVDYLQLVRGDGRSENRVQEISDISRSLKALAREMDCPVLALSQLSRAVEQRPSHQPMLSDLRESGSIEQDADVVMFIHRDDKYVSREEWDRTNPDTPYPQGIANIIVAKHRNGPQGQRSLRFREEIARFENCPVEDQIEQPALPRFSG